MRLPTAGFDTPTPYGAFYIMPRISKYSKNSEEFSEKMMKAVEVAVVPGSGFGTYSNDCVRMCYAMDDKLLEEGFNRIEKFLKTL